MSYDYTTKWVPKPTPETQEFWDGAARGELRIQRCDDCDRAYFYPRPLCPHCGSENTDWFTASGRATLYSYSISMRSVYGYEAPYSIAIVTLEEGPRMLTNIVDIEQTPEHLILDMPLEVRFENRGAHTVPVFAPAAAQFEEAAA